MCYEKDDEWVDDEWEGDKWEGEDGEVGWDDDDAFESLWDDADSYN